MDIDLPATCTASAFHLDLLAQYLGTWTSSISHEQRKVKLSTIAIYFFSFLLLYPHVPSTAVNQARRNSLPVLPSTQQVTADSSNSNGHKLPPAAFDLYV